MCQENQHQELLKIYKKDSKLYSWLIVWFLTRLFVCLVVNQDKRFSNSNTLTQFETKRYIYGGIVFYCWKNTTSQEVSNIYNLSRRFYFWNWKVYLRNKVFLQRRPIMISWLQKIFIYRKNGINCYKRKILFSVGNIFL